MYDLVFFFVIIRFYLIIRMKMYDELVLRFKRVIIISKEYYISVLFQNIDIKVFYIKGEGKKRS